MTTYNTMIEAYNNTLKNCRFYEEEGCEACLLNEIGVLRGIFYCLELVSIDLIADEELFLHYIAIQQKLKRKEGLR